MELVINRDIFFKSFNPNSCYSMILGDNTSIYQEIMKPISSSRLTNVNFYADKHLLATIYVRYKNTRDPSENSRNLIDRQSTEYLIIDASDKRIQYLQIKDNIFIKAILENLNLYNITLILLLNKDIFPKDITDFERSFDFILKGENCMINKNFHFFDTNLIKSYLKKFYFSSLYKLTPLPKDLITFIVLEYLDG